MSCKYTIDGKEYSLAEFKAYLVDGGLDSLYPDGNYPSVEKNKTNGFLDSHAQIEKQLDEGDITADKLRESFENIVLNKDAVYAELNKLSKAELIRRYGSGYLSSSDKKDRYVSQSYKQILMSYRVDNSGFFSHSGGESFVTNLRAELSKVTDADIKDYADNLAKQKENYTKELNDINAGMENPVNFSDYARIINSKMKEDKLTFKQAYLSLPIEQQIAFDNLWSEKTRSERKAKTDQQKTEVKALATTADGEIVETVHSQKGIPLFVVKASERVDKDTYSKWNETAKRMGGYYSAYKLKGAVPGFQFKTKESAEAFLKFIGGDATSAKEIIQTRRDVFADDKSQTAVERLNEMADKLEEKTDDSLNQDRKQNTARRARQAASAEMSALRNKSLAQTMRNIAKAISDGKANLLDKVRQKTQVEMLQSMLSQAHNNKVNKLYIGKGKDYAKEANEKPNDESVSYTDFPDYTVWRSNLADMGRKLIETEGFKKLGTQILKEADDVTKAYTVWAKENIDKVSVFLNSDHKPASFTSKDIAEKAISRNGYKGQAIVFLFKRGDNRIILSPSEAIKRGLWTGDDTMVALSPSLGNELVEKIGKANRRKGTDINVAWQLENSYEKRKRLAAMGIETAAELRAALREFLALKSESQQPNKIKELERSMVGRANDGLDFFPTPAKIADEMIEAADIQDGMSVLEPSAGMGHIAERIREAGHDADVVEYSARRKELLEAKGFNVVGDDFMSITPESGLYDRIIMNPPFGKRQDAQHVMHAYDLLAPNGRVVAIMGEGVFFGKDKKAVEFRDWLESVGGTEEKLPEGSFNDPSLPVNTGVNVRMVVIDKGNQDITPTQAEENTIVEADGIKQPELNSDDLAKYIADAARSNGYGWSQNKDGTFNIKSSGVHIATARYKPNSAEELTELVLKNYKLALDREGKKLPSNPKEMTRDQFYIASRFGKVINDFEISGDDLHNKTGGITTNADGGFAIDHDALYDRIQQDAALFSKSTKTPTNTHTKKSLSSAIKSVMDKTFGDGWTDRLMATGKFKVISRDEAVGLIGKNAMFHKVWHGSPHNHDKFDLSKIGTGEGAQAFGYGHYFTDAKSIAEWYRDKLSGGIKSKIGVFGTNKSISSNDFLNSELRMLFLKNQNADVMLNFAKERLNEYEADKEVDQKERLKYGLEKLKLTIFDKFIIELKNDISFLNKIKLAGGFNSNGKLYEVELAPSQDEYLDWDKPLNEQSNFVKKALLSINDESLSKENQLRLKATHEAVKGNDAGNRNGEMAYFTLSKILGSDKVSSSSLHAIGIRGIRYKAGGGKSEANNYVVFDDNDINIEAKYSKDGHVIAFYNPKDDTSYFVRDNISQDQSADSILGLVTHEVGVHALQLGKSNAEFKTLLARFEKLRDINPKIKAAFDRVPDDTKTEHITEEALAYFLENNSTSTLAQRIIEAFRKLVKAIGNTLIGKDKFKYSQWANKLTEQELRNMATSALRSAPESLLFDNVDRKNGDVMLGKSSQERLAPNGKPSNLNAMQYKQVRTPEFKTWFGDWENDPENSSKVVDENGEPLVVYHFTDNKFTNFNKDISDGFWFADNKSADTNEDIGANGSKYIMKVFLNAKEPLLNGPNGDVESIASEGYDGIENRYDYGTDYAVIESNQIKSAAGNNGEFNPENNDIRFSRAPLEDIWSDTAALPKTTNEELKDRLRDIKDTGRINIKALGLSALTQNQLVKLGEETLPIFKNFSIERNNYDVTEANIHKQGDDIASRWQRLVPNYKPMDKAWAARNKLEMHRLADMMHSMTVLELDPRETKPEDADNAVWDELVTNYNKLLPNSKKVLDDAEKFHKDRLNDLLSSITEKLDNSNAPIEDKKRMEKELNKKFKAVKGPYFPLMRFGQYWVDHAEGFNMFETKSAQERFIKQLKDEGIDIKGFGKTLTDFQKVEGIDAGLVNDVNDLIDKLDVEQGDMLKDSIFQLYLTALPESSMRKRFIHRKKTPGFATDALRSFSKKAFHDGKQIAKMKYMPKMKQVLKDIATVVKAGDSTKEYERIQSNIGKLKDALTQLNNGAQLNEIEGNAELLNQFNRYSNQDELKAAINKYIDQQKYIIKNADIYINAGKDSESIADITKALQKSYANMIDGNSVHLISSIANQTAFTYMLGFSPSSALINFMQTPGVALPVIAGRHGFVKSSKALADATKDFFTNKDQDGFSILNGLKNDGERALYKALSSNGTFDRSRAHDLMGLSEQGVERGTLHRDFMMASSYMFHHVEIANREITALTAYRMEFEKTGDVQKSIAYADDIVKETHLDYSSANRPDLFQGNAARVMLQFKMFSQGMTWLWGKTLYDAFKSNNPERKAEARNIMLCLSGTQIAAAGVLGLPIGGILMAVQALLSLFDDDDEPKDVENEIRKALSNTLGPDIGRIVSVGALSESGADFHSRLSLSDLWVREPDKELEGKDQAYYLLKTVIGPIAGVAENVLVGMKLISDGNTERGIEKILPNAISGAAKSYRLINEGGAKSLTGETIYETNAYEQALQAIGMRPSGLTEQMNQNAAIKNREQVVQHVRQKLLNHAANAKIEKNASDLKDAMENIKEFNAKYPKDKINQASILRSVKKRLSNQKAAVSGININKKLRGLVDEESFM